uniref:Uncharacterized protein n=1 Tax=Rhizophora mucronata TaxID=61149 RepID=A0A2P2QY96_RHIMU
MIILRTMVVSMIWLTYWSFVTMELSVRGPRQQTTRDTNFLKDL